MYWVEWMEDGEKYHSDQFVTHEEACRFWNDLDGYPGVSDIRMLAVLPGSVPLAFNSLLRDSLAYTVKEDDPLSPNLNPVPMIPDPVIRQAFESACDEPTIVQA